MHVKVRVNYVGQPCRHCGTPVVKKEHPPGKVHAPDRYWYLWWLRCPSCKAIYLIESVRQEPGTVAPTPPHDADLFDMEPADSFTYVAPAPAITVLPPVGHQITGKAAIAIEISIMLPNVALKLRELGAKSRSWTYEACVNIVARMYGTSTIGLGKKEAVPLFRRFLDDPNAKSLVIAPPPTPAPPRRIHVKKIKRCRPPRNRRPLSAVVELALRPDFYNSREWKTLRYEALLKYGPKCMVCNATRETGVQIHVDHIKPRSRFPELALDINNIQIACEPCNMGKGAWDQTDWRPAAATA